MNPTALSSKGLYQVLKRKGITHLFHANTVATALTFIENRSLLSRDFVEKNNLYQTPQRSDEKDKLVGVWNDIFIDPMDFHVRYKKPNSYGPVVFILKLEILNTPDFQDVFITKGNPEGWNLQRALHEYYHSDLSDVETNYKRPGTLESQTMFTFRAPEQRLKLNKYLAGIGIDQPSIAWGLSDKANKMVSNAYHKISEALHAHGLKQFPLKVRHKTDASKGISCSCWRTYNGLFYFNQAMFAQRFSISSIE